MLVPSQSWLGPGRMEDRSAGFGAFVRALAAEAADANPKARFLSGSAQLRSGLIWAMLLLGSGAAMLLLFSVSADFAGFGIALAARLVFLLLLIAAVLPWVERRAGTFDPRDIPANLL